MKKMKDSCFNEFDPNAMSVEAALENILKSISSIKTSEYVDLKSAYGRILSKNIKSKINVPNYKNSAMDGYAVNVGDFNEKNKTYDFKSNGYKVQYTIEYSGNDGVLVKYTKYKNGEYSRYELCDCIKRN